MKQIDYQLSLPPKSKDIKKTTIKRKHKPIMWKAGPS